MANLEYKNALRLNSSIDQYMILHICCFRKPRWAVSASYASPSLFLPGVNLLNSKLSHDTVFDHYPHKPNKPDDTTACECIICFGITHDNLISIQGAVAICLQHCIG